jgi:hypothetical protein
MSKALVPVRLKEVEERPRSSPEDAGLDPTPEP